ncbi:unnamed protein product [Allacma fusca]|uniref:Uncharacterized protein n=1 Tax=Allacma fusca TaxID=39272 RepID=A0A8J2Q2P4_9HEXA|nr:unnamed protein product [Allacma fusca]
MAQNSKASKGKGKITVPPLKIHEKCPYGHQKFPPPNKLPELEKPEITIKPACAEYCGQSGDSGKPERDSVEMSIQFNLPDAEDPRRETYLSNLFEIMEPFFESSESSPNTKKTPKKTKPDPESKVTTMIYAEFK